MLSGQMSQEGSGLPHEIVVDHYHDAISTPSRDHSFSDSDDEGDGPGDLPSHPGSTGEGSTEFHQMVEATRLVGMLAVSRACWNLDISITARVFCVFRR